jgi:hypothetical protein
VSSSVNQGLSHRLTVNIKPKIVADDADVIFDGGEVGIDWSEYSFAQAFSFRVKPTDTNAITLGASTVEALYIKTTAPIEVDYTQDGIARVAYVKPLVKPAGWFTTDNHSPSDSPAAYQAGVLLLTGGVISVLTIKGLAACKAAANVIVAIAGYNT